MKKLTKKAIKEYIWSPNHCPYCNSENITADSFEPEGKYQLIQCNDCEKKWIEIFELVTIESTEE